MKYLLSHIFIVLFIYAQAQNADMIIQEATNSAFSIQNPNAALQVLNDVSSYVSQSNDSLQVEYYLGLGTSYGMLGNTDSSLLALDEAEKILNTNFNDILASKVFNVKGLVHMSNGNYEKSLSFFQKCIEISLKSDHDKSVVALMKAYGNSAGIYFQLGEYNKAVDITKKALDLSIKQNDKSSMAYNYLRLALSYVEIDSLDQSIDNLRQASIFLEELNDTTTLIYAENNLGKVYTKQSQYSKALPHLLKAYQLSDAIGSIEEKGLAMISLSSNYLKMGQLQESEKYAIDALIFGKSHNFPGITRDAHDLMYRIKLELNDLKNSLFHRNQYFIISDSLSGIEMKSRVVELETKYETEKKEAEIERLSLENDLQQANIRKAQITQTGILIIFFGSVLFTIVYFRQRTKKQKLEKEAQELQIEALKKRFMELHASPSELAVELDFEELNSKLNTPLTEREFETFKLSIEGKTNAEIGDSLYISVSTVKFHLRNAYSKMGVGNRKEAFQYMLKTS